MDLDGWDYWVAVNGGGYWRYEIAGRGGMIDWKTRARNLLGGNGEWLYFADPARGRYRGARLDDGRLRGCLFIAGGHELPSRSWLGGLFGDDVLDTGARASLLAGRPANGRKDTGETVCACFNVGMNSIVDAIRDKGAISVEAIGVALEAGTNCGSCLPELARILACEQTPRAA